MISEKEKKIWLDYLVKKGLIVESQFNNTDKINILLNSLIAVYGSDMLKNPYHVLFYTINAMRLDNPKIQELAISTSCDQVFDLDLIKDFIRILWS